MVILLFPQHNCTWLPFLYMRKQQSMNGCVNELENSCILLNTRVSKKKLCLFGKCRGTGQLFFVSAPKIPKIRHALCGLCKVLLALLVVWPGCGCSLVYIMEYK